MDDVDILGGEEAPEETPTQQAPAPPAGMSVEEQEQRMVQIFGPTLGALGQRLASIESGLSSRSQASQPDSSDAPSSSELDAFLEKPNASMEAVAKKVLSQANAGNRIPENLTNSVAGFHLMGERQRIDNEYGLGTFDKEIAPRLRAPLSHLNNDQKVDPSILHTLVTAAMGQDGVRQQLHERRDAVRKEANKPPTLMGAGAMNAARSADRLTPEESELCGKVEMDPKVYLEMRKSGVTDLDGFDAMQKRMSKGAK